MNTKTFLILSFVGLSMVLAYNFFDTDQKLIYMQGYIVPEESNSKLYLQDVESGNYTLLQFAFDDFDNLVFDDMDFVEVIGYYEHESNVLDVEIIHDLQRSVALRELSYLE